MQFKSSKLFIVLILTMLSMLVITGCGKSGSRFDNENPIIRITSYEGFDGSETYSSQDTLTFQQKIYWHANDPDGVIQGYAFRILDSQNNPVETPGYPYIDEDGAITPTNVQNLLGNGWVIHYLPGADQSIPLDNPQAKRSIWTSQKFAVINFPSADANGNPLPSAQHKFEVIAIDNRGGITPIPAFRQFNTTSLPPDCTVVTTKGNPNGEAVGSGLKLFFTMTENNLFLANTPWYYEFKLQKINPNPNDPTVVLDETEWFRTDSNNNPKLNEYLLTRDTTPALSYDFDSNGTQIYRTRVVGRVYNLSGVSSDITALSSNMLFAVKPGFKPEAKIYDPKIHALGDNHYLDYTYEDQKTPAEVMPFTVTGGEVKYAIPLFKDLNNKNTAVNSQNFKIWLRWGWLGEYGKVMQDGSIVYTGATPYDKKVDTVLDSTLPETADANYFSEITHFDLRFDGNPYNFPPYANSIQTDNDGTRWLRIPSNSVLGQGVVLANLPSGEHTFSVRVVDLQNVPSDPVEYKFTLVDPISPANRSGILVIDQDSHNQTNSPEPYVTDFYNYILSGADGTKDFINLPTSSQAGNTYQDRRDRRLAYSDLMRYKFVIYHSDRPGENGDLFKDCDGLLIYLQNGGNLLISGAENLSAGTISPMVSNNQQTLLQALGIEYSANAVLPAGSNIANNPFFQSAVGQAGFANIGLKYGTGDDASFNTLVNLRQGMGAVSYFDPTLITAEPIFKYGCKPTTSTVTPPTQEQYDTFSQRIVGVRHINGEGRAYTLGFPLSYMIQSEARDFMNHVFTEIGL